MPRTSHFLALLLLTLCLHANAFAQKYSTTSKKAIKLYEKAEDFFRNRQFDEGIASLQKSLSADPNFTEAHYRLATTYELFRRYEEAAASYKRVIEIQPDNPRYQGVFLLVARNELMKGNYQDTKKFAEKSIALNPNNDKNNQVAQMLVDVCDYSIEGIKKPLDFKPKLLEAPLNQFKVQYFPVLTGDEQTIVFSIRKFEAKREPEDDLYVSYKKEDKWSEPQSISSQINTIDNEGACSISADGKVFVFTYCNNLKLRRSFGACDLYISYKTGDKWSEPENLGPNVNSPAQDTQPALSSDGKTLYFASNRAGSLGSLDIWVAKMDEKGEWQPAQNLGKNINTTGKEESPFIHANNRYLYFSSDGYPKMSYGGADLYQSEYINQEWTKPTNLGYPVNNHENQVGLFITTDGKRGYYTAEGGEGSIRDRTAVLKVFDMPAEIQPKIKSNFVKGYVYDSKTQGKLESKIELFDLTTNTKQSSVTSDPKTGEYLFVLNQGSEYALGITKKDYAYKSITFNYTEGKDIEALVFNIALDPISKGTVFRLNNIFFATNSYELADKSKAELDELVKFMKENTQVKGEISGHTDNIGNPEANKTLSLARAKSVLDYLVNAGIDKDRLKFQGYGANRPSATNDTEEGRAQNRRIEFEIL